MNWKEAAKKRVASEAVKHVEDGFIIGLGSGSTAAYVINEIGLMKKQERLQVLGVPSSSQAMLLAVKSGIPLTTLDEHPNLDLTIDGADEIDNKLNMIKGGGGALTKEKVVASAAKKVVIVADQTKLVEKLGTKFRLPIEIFPFALSTVSNSVKKLGGKPFLREGKNKVGAVVTDNCNYILDVEFGPIADVEELNRKLKFIPGLIETGLFLNLADIVYLGKEDGIIKLEK